MPPRQAKRSTVVAFAVILALGLVLTGMGSWLHWKAHADIVDKLYRPLESEGSGGDGNNHGDNADSDGHVVGDAAQQDDPSAGKKTSADQQQPPVKKPYWGHLPAIEGKKARLKEGAKPIGGHSGGKKKKKAKGKTKGKATSEDSDHSPVQPVGGSHVVVNSGKGASAELSYLTVISNEDFVDGALVLGASLHMNCPYLQTGKAALTMIVTQGRLSDESMSRLKTRGGYTTIVEVPSLAKRAPKAFWKDTFDKIYMFNLTQFQKVVFMDADMICVRSMDALFDKDFGSPTRVAAIGNKGSGKHGDTYFQTGMMVIQPTDDMFRKIYEEFESGVPPRGSHYNSGMNSRDGVLLRKVFGSNFAPLDNKYSRNLNPRFHIPKDVISLHLRGKHKPWFDRSKPNADPELGKKEFGFPYTMWWEIYEEKIHDRAETVVNFGGDASGDGITPKTHAWMMRHTKSEYVQLLSDVDRENRNHTLPGLELVRGGMGESCDTACAAHKKADSSAGSHKCALEAFNFSSTQDCATITSFFPECEERCDMYVYWRPHKGADFPGLDVAPTKKANKKPAWCRFNLMLDDRHRSNCQAFNETTARLCPCVPSAAP